MEFQYPGIVMARPAGEDLLVGRLEGSVFFSVYPRPRQITDAKGPSFIPLSISVVRFTHQKRTILTLTPSSLLIQSLSYQRNSTLPAQRLSF